MHSVGDLADGDTRKNAHPRFQKTNFARNQVLLTTLKQIAATRDLTPSQVAIAWLLSHRRDVAPIPGTRHVAHVEENLRAAEVRLSSEEVAALSGAFAPERRPAIATVT